MGGPESLSATRVGVRRVCCGGAAGQSLVGAGPGAAVVPPAIAEPEADPDALVLLGRGQVAEVLVIGAGSAGAAAASAALSAGVSRVLLVDGARPGYAGWSAGLAVATLCEAASSGLEWGQARLRLRGVRREVVTRHEARLRELRTRSGGRLLPVPGLARCMGPGLVGIDPLGVAAGTAMLRVRARRVVVATGSTPRLPEISGLLDTAFVTVPELDDLLDLDPLPATVAVLGAGSTGCALAQGLARLGVGVTLVEARPGILPREDPDAAQIVQAALRQDGVRVLTGATVVKVAPTLDGGAWIGTEAGADVAVERLVLAAGWEPATAGLQASLAGGVLTPDGALRVDDRLAAATGLLAAGSATGELPHRSAAAEMGRIAGVNAAARRPRQRWRGEAVPVVTFTDPELATVGVTGLEAAGVPGALVGEVPLAACDRSCVVGRRDGLVRVVLLAGSGPRRAREPHLLGATVVAPRAGELIGQMALAVQAGVPVSALLATVAAECSWTAAVQDAVHAALETGRPPV